MEFRTTRTIYRYENVPAEVFAGLVQAGSLGSYFNQNVKAAGFSYRRVRTRKEQDDDGVCSGELADTKRCAEQSEPLSEHPVATPELLIRMLKRQMRNRPTEELAAAIRQVLIANRLNKSQRDAK